MEVREAADDDWEAIWPFFREIVAAEETYVYDPEISEPDARDLWMIGPPGATFVAVDDGAVVGSANAYANRPGPGKHVASASFMVDLAHTGKGIGRALGERVIEWATETGFRGLVFNAVVESNAPAVALWKSLGLEIIGTVPEAFRLPDGTFTGLHIMYLRLAD